MWKQLIVGTRSCQAPAVSLKQTNSPFGASKLREKEEAELVSENGAIRVVWKGARDISLPGQRPGQQHLDWCLSSNCEPGAPDRATQWRQLGESHVPCPLCNLLLMETAEGQHWWKEG